MIVNCNKCKIKFKKTNSEVKRSKTGRHYCSKSCAASINNLGVERNKKVKRTCNRCSKEYSRTTRHKSPLICKSCSTGIADKREAAKNTSIGEYQVKGKPPSWKNSAIRNFCRSWNKELRELPCQSCGYDKHVELCHVKPITSFGSTATLREVNSPDNILVLCRNCHWEFDHSLLPIAEIPKRD